MGEESNARCVDCTRFEQYAQMAEKERDDARDEVDWLRAKLTALRAAAEIVGQDGSGWAELQLAIKASQD